MVLREFTSMKMTQTSMMMFLQLAEGKTAKEVANNLDINYQFVLRKAAGWKDSGMLVMHRSGKCGYYSLTKEGERFVRQQCDG